MPADCANTGRNQNVFAVLQGFHNAACDVRHLTASFLSLCYVQHQLLDTVVVSCRVCRYSPIDFDYMGFSEMRWGEYHRRKEEFVTDARRIFNTSA